MRENQLANLVREATLTQSAEVFRYRNGEGDRPCAPVQDERQHPLRVYDFYAGCGEPGDLECDVGEERDEAE